jgi:uncharacterized protein YceH (UPF0502 family)
LKEAQVALKGDLKEAQTASELRQQAAQVALKGDLKEAQTASELRQQAAQVALKGDLKEALTTLETNMNHTITQKSQWYKLKHFLNLLTSQYFG